MACTRMGTRAHTHAQKGVQDWGALNTTNVRVLHWRAIALQKCHPWGTFSKVFKPSLCIITPTCGSTISSRREKWQNYSCSGYFPILLNTSRRNSKCDSSACVAFLWHLQIHILNKERAGFLQQTISSYNSIMLIFIMLLLPVIFYICQERLVIPLWWWYKVFLKKS